MADSIDVTFGDLNLLAFDLTQAPERVRPMAGKALTKAGNDVIAISRQLVPVDTSATQNSIGMDSRPLERVIGPTTAYAPFLEMGTSRMPPHAFMGPAADLVGPGLSEAMAQLGAEVMRR